MTGKGAPRLAEQVTEELYSLFRNRWQNYRGEKPLLKPYVMRRRTKHSFVFETDCPELLLYTHHDPDSDNPGVIAGTIDIDGIRAETHTFEVPSRVWILGFHATPGLAEEVQDGDLATLWTIAPSDAYRIVIAR